MKKANEGHNQSFDKVLWGYESGQVDTYLQGLAKKIEELETQLSSLRIDKGDLLEELEGYKDREAAIKETMLAASGVADEIRQNARREAEHVVTHAHQRAREILDGIESHRADLLVDLSQLKHKHAHAVLEFKRMLQAHMDIVHSHEQEIARERTKENALPRVLSEA